MLPLAIRGGSVNDARRGSGDVPMSAGVLAVLDVAIQNLLLAEFTNSEVEPMREARDTVAELMVEFVKAADALQAIAAMGGDATDKEVADKTLRIARLWRADDGHDSLLKRARAAGGHP